MSSLHAIAESEPINWNQKLFKSAYGEEGTESRSAQIH